MGSSTSQSERPTPPDEMPAPRFGGVTRNVSCRLTQRRPPQLPCNPASPAPVLSISLYPGTAKGTEGLSWLPEIVLYPFATDHSRRCDTLAQWRGLAATILVTARATQDHVCEAPQWMPSVFLSPRLQPIACLRSHSSSYSKAAPYSCDLPPAACAPR